MRPTRARTVGGFADGDSARLGERRAVDVCALVDIGVCRDDDAGLDDGACADL
ncbi:hypothetical protein [Salana multivorans]